jgi:2,4-dienoyl-CoA reductase-like NADH-dependent reductase (Old Yellow Enzyme family)/thioredoxin reductase
MILKPVTQNKFPILFTPQYIGNLRVKNRVIRSPMQSSLGTPDGCVTERVIAHYREFARGGAGVVIVEHTFVDDIASKAAMCQLGISRPDHQPGLRWLAQTIKDNGAVACLQISHCGRQKFLGTRPYKSAHRTAWPDLHCPEDPGRKGAPVPDELTIEEIEELIEAFGNAAERARNVGFDMIEVHAGHGYLITNFLSPDNRRPDWYGGPLENRMRFLLQVFDNMRRKCGPDFPMGARLSGTDYDPYNPIPVEETVRVAQELEKHGASYIHASGGYHQMGHMETVTMYQPLAFQAWAAEKIKKAVKIPVVCSGSITSPELAEKILQEGKGDFVGLGRPLVADPHYPRKALEGHPEDIRPCIRCCECNDFNSVISGYLTCTVNSAAGRESELTTIPAKAERKRKIAVIGGGPAGMEAARIASLRGHEVTLYEKEELGGLLKEASIPDFKADLRPLIKYHIAQLEKNGVKVVKQEVTAKAIQDSGCDAVIVAAGSEPVVPDVPGIKKPNVVSALDVLHGAKLGNNVIMVGGGLVGSELAMFVARQGKKVTIVEAMDKIAQGLTLEMKRAFFSIISTLPIEIRCGQMLTEVLNDGIMTLCGLKKEKIEGDTVVIAIGFKPNRKIWNEISALPGIEAYAVGDCVAVQTCYEAIHDGYNAGLIVGRSY